MKQLYEAGPMTGYPEYNHGAFNRDAGRLRRAGYEVFSPAEHDIDLGIDVNDDSAPQSGTDSPMMRKVLGDDLAWITGNAEGIALLDGWVHSKGTRAEVATALAIGIPVAPVGIWLFVADEPDHPLSIERLTWWTDASACAMDGTLRYAVPGMVMA